MLLAGPDHNDLDVVRMDAEVQGDPVTRTNLDLGAVEGDCPRTGQLAHRQMHRALSNRLGHHGVPRPRLFGIAVWGHSY